MMRFALAVLVSCIYIAEARQLHARLESNAVPIALMEPRLPVIEVIQVLENVHKVAPAVISEFQQPYCSYKIIGEYVISNIRRIIDFQKPTPFQKSFAALNFAIHKTGEVVSKGVDYDAAFNCSVKLVRIGQLVPHLARDYDLNLFSNADEKTKPINSWIDKILACHPVISREVLESCDQQVSYLLQSHPSYRKPAKLIVEVGKVSSLFYSKKKEIEAVAKTHTEEIYVENGRHCLRPLVLQMAAVFKALQNC